MSMITSANSSRFSSVHGHLYGEEFATDMKAERKHNFWRLSVRNWPRGHGEDQEKTEMDGDRVYGEQD